MSQKTEETVTAQQPVAPAAEAQAAPSSPVPEGERQPDRSPTTVRIAKDSSLRKLITFVMARVSAGSVVTIQALTLQVQKAIKVASITRDRLGNVHQVNSLLVVQERAGEEGQSPRQTSGIQIVLSLDPLSTSEVGYEKPKPKGFAQHSVRRYRGERPPRAPRSADSDDGDHGQRAKSSASGPKVNDTVDDAATKMAPRGAQNRQRRKRERRPRADSDPAGEQVKAQPDKTPKDGEAKDAPAPKRDRSRRQKKSRSKTSDAPPKKESASPAPAESRGDRGDRGDRRDQQRQPPQRYQDFDHMGRPLRNGPPFKEHSQGQGYGGGGGRGRLYQGRGGGYQTGQSHRFMMNYRDDGYDPYFARYDGPPPFRPYNGMRGMRGEPHNGMRGMRGGPRPGYFPASRRPQHPDQLIGDMPEERPRRGGFAPPSKF